MRITPVNGAAVTLAESAFITILVVYYVLFLIERVDRLHGIEGLQRHIDQLNNGLEYTDPIEHLVTILETGGQVRARPVSQQ